MSVDVRRVEAAARAGWKHAEHREKYRTIVADPPWDHADGTGVNLDGEERRTTHLPYATMTLDAIKALPVRDLTASGAPDANGVRDGAHLYLWTTTRFLIAAHDVMWTWGFRLSAVLTWCKPPRGVVGGSYASNVEFCLFGRRGWPPAGGERMPTRWFQWPVGEHSAKPDAFIDMVERVSPSPYLELFARRARFGWDYWGDESLGTVELPAERVNAYSFMCICPPDVLAHGGFKRGCPAHG